MLLVILSAVLCYPAGHIFFYISTKEVMFLIVFAVKFYEGVLGSKNNKWLDFDSDLDHDSVLVDVLRSLSTWNMMTVCRYFMVKQKEHHRMAI